MPISWKKKFQSSYCNHGFDFGHRVWESNILREWNYNQHLMFSNKHPNLGARIWCIRHICQAQHIIFANLNPVFISKNSYIKIYLQATRTRHFPNNFLSSTIIVIHKWPSNSMASPSVCVCVWILWFFQGKKTQWSRLYRSFS